MKPDLESTLFLALEALEATGVRFALVGGLAVAAWAVPRATRDVDLYAELESAARVSLQRELEARGFSVPAMEDDLARFGVFRSRSPDGVFVDVFDAVGPLGQAILDRRRSIRIGDRSVWLIAPDDLAVLKAFSDRPRDFEDLCGLIAALPDLDREYVEGWAARLDESIGGSEVSERVRAAFERL